MGRFLAGVGSTLLLVAAGFFWWQGAAQRDTVDRPDAPPAALATEPLAMPPQADERSREQKRFDRYDKDRNQAISREEYLASRRKAFARLDLNHDGRLDFDEWAKKTTDKFARADADHSNALTRAEFLTTRVVRKTPVRRDCPPPRAVDGDEG
ncbi:histidine kinase [Sphingomonas flavalba]|uniref:histidine kinase n=1 Tax=Sphingomonas flavalba TaxID=2559804 RepID=UPI0039E1485E